MHECSTPKHRLVANERPYTNFLHGPVPVHWCSNPIQPKECDLGGVNSLCLPSGCHEKSWCSLNHDCSALNGHWSKWSDKCSGTGEDGTRSRTCDKPAPKHGGKPCIGNGTKACTGTTKRFPCGCSYVGSVHCHVHAPLICIVPSLVSLAIEV